MEERERDGGGGSTVILCPWPFDLGISIYFCIFLTSMEVELSPPINLFLAYTTTSRMLLLFYRFRPSPFLVTKRIVSNSFSFWFLPHHFLQHALSLDDHISTTFYSFLVIHPCPRFSPSFFKLSLAWGHSARGPFFLFTS